MNIGKYELSIIPDIEWEELEVLWNKKINYNWYSCTVVHFSWSFGFKRNKEEVRKRIGSKMKISNFSKTWIEIKFGLLGFNFTFIISEYWDDDE